MGVEMQKKKWNGSEILKIEAQFEKRILNEGGGGKKNGSHNGFQLRVLVSRFSMCCLLL